MVSQDDFVLGSLGPVAGFARHDHGFLFLFLAASPPKKERETIFWAAGLTVNCKIPTNLVKGAEIIRHKDKKGTKILRLSTKHIPK